MQALRSSRLHKLQSVSRACLLLAMMIAETLATGCIGGSKKQQNKGFPAVASSPTAVLQASPAAVTTPVVLAVATPGMPITPSANTPSPTPTPTPTTGPAVRDENGLRIQDVAFSGKVTVSGGLRIRSAPATDAPVVGSLAEGTLVNVEGKVLNGGEAEQGKGTVWFIVGVKQYIYGAEGYIQTLGTPTPAPAR